MSTTNISKSRLAAASLHGSGEMATLIRSFDWSTTDLGPIDTWPPHLLTAVNMMLNCQFPMLIWWGPSMVQLYNDAFRAHLGQEGKHATALGQGALDCWREIWHIIGPLVEQVMSGGPAVFRQDQLMPIFRNALSENVYWTYSYSRIDDDHGNPAGVLIVCNETTDRVLDRKLMEQTYRSQLAAYQELDKTNKELAHRDERLSVLIDQAPVAISVLTGPDLTIESANEMTLRLWGKSAKVIGQPIRSVLPELVGQPFFDALSEVYSSGLPYAGIEIQAVLHQDGGPQVVNLNFIYHPITDEEGHTSTIMVIATDVTDQVQTRTRIEANMLEQQRMLDELKSREEKLRLAAAAAELGMFDMDLIKGTMEWDSRCRQLFGIAHSNDVTYEHDFLKGLHPDDRDRISELIDNLFIKEISNGDYDVEYRTVGFEDKKVRWVRAKGKVFFDDRDRAVRFIGSVLDITDIKTDEQRKNDFIGMVSHELKTPLTSIKAYIQMLKVEAQHRNDSFFEEALQRVENQANKMTAMTNGFLNVSRLESGKIQLNLSRFNMEDLVAEVMNDTRQANPQANLSYCTYGPAIVIADSEKISHVLANLLSNALKYSPGGAPVKVTCGTHGGFVQVSVKDYGIGIDPQDLERLFERYYRVSNTHTQHISGFGIGLYLSAEITKIHKGRIWAESEKGKGSIFYFCLPLDGGAIAQQ